MKLTEKLKVTRGKGYYTVLKQILDECGQQMVDDAKDIIAANGKFTPLNIGQIAIKYDLNFKATCEWLEESRVIPVGTYDRLVERGLKARIVLQEAAAQFRQSNKNL